MLATLVPSDDGLGLFLHRAQEGFGDIDWDDVSITWDLGANGVTKESVVEVEVIETLSLIVVREA